MPGVKGLRVECDRVIAAAASREQEQATAEHVHAQRTLRHSARGGTGTITMTGPLDRTAAVMAALEPFEQAIFTDNRTRKTPEHATPTAFDAMVELARVGEGTWVRMRRGPVDRWRRCTCTSPTRRTGAGTPCPVRSARSKAPDRYRSAPHDGLSSEAIIKALVVKGTDVTRVVSLGRTIPAALATAIRTEQRTVLRSRAARSTATSNSTTTSPTPIGGETSRAEPRPPLHPPPRRQDPPRPAKTRAAGPTTAGHHRRIPSRADRRRVTRCAVPCRAVSGRRGLRRRAADRYRPSLVGKRSGKSAARPSALARKASPMSAVSNIAAFQFAMYSRPSDTEWSRV